MLHRPRGVLAVMGPIERMRTRMLAAALEPFSHGGDPLANTLEYDGDPGVFGPDSVTWPLMADVAALFGGVRALLIQFAHPEVAAGMVDHSGYERDHLGRISRTTDYVAATSFGAMPEVAHAVGLVRRAHKRIVGRSHRDRAYTADDYDLTSWVHNALSESFLVSYRTFGPGRFAPADADRFAAEQVKLGQVMEADQIPDTAAALSAWIADHPQIGPSPGAATVVPFIAKPPAGWSTLIGYKFLYWAACATIPRRIRSVLGIRRYPGAITAGKLMARVLRWMMGSSPAWLAALYRTGAPIPHDIQFRQPLPGNQPIPDARS